MIVTKSLEGDFLTEFTDGARTALADAPASKGGAGAGFSPFALLEASLATCINITLRNYAKSHDVALGDIEVSATLSTGADGTTFTCVAKLPEGLDEAQVKRLRAAMKGCPIHAILSKDATFEMKTE